MQVKVGILNVQRCKDYVKIEALHIILYYKF